MRGLDATVAKQLYQRAAQAVQPAAPPKALQQTHVDTWLDAAQQAGFETLSDDAEVPTKVRQDITWVDRMVTGNDGVRRDAFTAYLQPLLKQGGKCARNVRIALGTAAHRIETRGSRAIAVVVASAAPAASGSSAVGGSDATPVSADTSGEQKVTARREVISCAGPFGSPPLLQRSGIGPRAVLADGGVDVVRDLPVGRGHQGRAFSFIVSSYAPSKLADENNRTELFAQSNVRQFLAGNGGVLGVGIAQTDGVIAESQTLVTSATASPPPADNDPELLGGCFVQPAKQSVGTIVADFKDPQAPPTVSPNFLSTAGEVQAALDCMDRHQTIHDNFPADFEIERQWPPKNNEFWVRNATEDGNHAVGGCNVGAVLDADLKVKGFDNLRVVDASAIPGALPETGPMSTVYMLAEHAATLIADGAGGGTAQVPSNSVAASRSASGSEQAAAPDGAAESSSSAAGQQLLRCGSAARAVCLICVLFCAVAMML